MQQAKKGDKVRVRYIGKLESGKGINQTKGSMPLVFNIGSGVVLSEFENAAMGMEKALNGSPHNSSMPSSPL